MSATWSPAFQWAEPESPKRWPAWSPGCPVRNAHSQPGRSSTSAAAGPRTDDSSAELMRPTDHRRLGSTGLSLTQMGFGGAPLGSMRTMVPDDAAPATLEAAWTPGLRYYDPPPRTGPRPSDHPLATSPQTPP